MTVEDLKIRYDYGYWANKKLFAVISRIPPEEFTRPVAGGHESIRNTLVHVFSAEWGWLDRCGGRPERGPRLEPANYPSLESLIALWTKVEGYVREFLSKLKDEDLTRVAEFPIPTGETRSLPIGHLLQHATTHGVHHRGQVAMMLRLLGHTPGNFDLLFYYAEKRRAPGS